MDRVNDYWLSRRPKYTQEQLFRIGQDYLLNCKLGEAARIFKLPALSSNSEAVWLAKHLKKYSAGRGRIKDYPSESSWARSSFDKDEDPRAFKYRFWYCHRAGIPISRLDILKDLAEAGDPICQYVLSEDYLLDTDQALAMHYFKRAGEQDFSRALYKREMILSESSFIDQTAPGEAGALLIRAATLGSRDALISLQVAATNRHREFGSALLEAVLAVTGYTIVGRLTYLTEVMAYNLAKLDSHQEDETTETPEMTADKLKCLTELFRLGSVFDDYRLYGDPVALCIRDNVDRAVTIYRRIASNARQSTIWTILGLRSLGVCRDIAIMIARLVYKTRADTMWYRST